MNVELLSRIQFATVALFHFLFVPLTLGLTVMVALMETRFARTGDEVWARMAQFWGRLLVVNFAVGVVTGITLEFQFGMNWAEYSKFVGDIFGAPLAIEAVVAFFLESTFIGLWMFSRGRVSRGVHAAIMWVVATASSLSAVWILLANGWMQNPRGFALAGGRAELTSFAAFLATPYSWIKVFHVLSTAYTLTGFFIMGISSVNLLARGPAGLARGPAGLAGSARELFVRSFRVGATFALGFSVLTVFSGDLSGRQVARYQPTKLAAIEAQWKTESHAPFHIVQWPDVRRERNAVEAIAIPGALSWLAYGNVNATVKGLSDFPPDERPPVIVPFLAFRAMVALGFLFALLALVAVYLAWRGDPLEHRWFLRIMAVAMALPYLACEIGWVVAEIGRQPWIVYGLLRTRDAVSRSLTPADLLISLVGFLVVYGALAAVDVYLLARYARRTDEQEAAR